MELDKSILLQKQVKDNSEDLRNEFLDMKNWEEQMKRKEQDLLNEHSGQHVLPPVRSKVKKKTVIKDCKSTENAKRIKSYDYKSWDKFDVDKACKELESEEQSNDSSEETISKEKLEKDHNKASAYKQQGNVFVQQKEWDKAIASYSKAIKIFPFDSIFYANRALCYLKQDNLYSAEADCSSAIRLDKTYVKAYHRRATARIGLKQYKEAKQDIEQILILEPDNKEGKALLHEINKYVSNTQHLTMPKEDIINDTPIEKKIAEKMLGITKQEKETEIKRNKKESNNTNAKSVIKPLSISVTESKKYLHIPDWLPERDNVKIVKPIEKPPHLRSKEPLKKIPVQQADLTIPFKDKTEMSYNTDQHTESSTNTSKDETKTKLEQIVTEIPPIPKTAVQFLIDWKKYTTSEVRYRYLKQLPSGSLPRIFQDSMETDIFSDIITTLKIEFLKREEHIFSYLKDLSNIKRFRTFIMFISSSEKQDLRTIFSYCKTFEKISEEDLIELQNKYEI